MNKQTIYFLFLFSIINIVSYAQVIEKKTKDDSKNTGNIIALLNSEQITDKRYNELLKDKLEYLYQSGSKNDLNSGIEDACFSQMIDEQLMIQEASKLGINVTYDFAFKILLDNPPQFVQDMFKSPNGNFRSDVYKQVIQNPMLITRYVNKPGKSEKQVTDEWKKDIIQLVNFVKREEVKKQLGNKLYKDKPLSTKMVLDRYFAEKTLITGSVVRAHHLSIPDSLVPVSDIEAKAWYEAHKSDYNFTESRYISSMIFQMSPTRSDSIKLKRSMDSVVKKCNETPKEKRPEYITSVMRNLPESKLPNGSFYTPSKVPKPLLEIVVKSKEGDIIGPIVQGFDASLIYIDKISQSNDTMIRARHIFLKAANDYNSDSSYVELLKKIRDTIKSDADFADYAQRFGQDGTLTKGGDLGYLGKGNTVHTFDSALFQNPSIGKLIGPIRTEFGHHLIYISDIWNKGYNIRELRFPYQISEKVQEDVEDNSQKFYDLLKAGKMNDSIAQAMKNKFPGSIIDTSQLERMENYGNTQILNEFAFNANVGDIGKFRTPGNRITIIKLLAKRPSGIPQFETFPNYVAAQAKRAKQMTMLKPKMQELSKKITVDMLVGPMEEYAKIINVFLMKGQPINTMPDEEPTLLDSLVTYTKTNQHSGPVRGKNGYYFLRVSEKSGPNMDDWERDKEVFAEKYLSKYKNAMVTDLINKSRSFSKVKDLRPQTIKVLKEFIKIE